MNELNSKTIEKNTKTNKEMVQFTSHLTRFNKLLIYDSKRRN